MRKIRWEQAGALVVAAVAVFALGRVSVDPAPVSSPNGVRPNQSTALGHEALLDRSGLENNTAFGYKAGQTLSGTGNTAVGTAALFEVGQGNMNTALGLHAGRGVDGSGNTLVGADAGAAPGVDNSVALGAGSVATEDDQVTVGQRDLVARALVLVSADGSRWRVTVDRGRLVARELGR